MFLEAVISKKKYEFYVIFRVEDHVTPSKRSESSPSRKNFGLAKMILAVFSACVVFFIQFGAHGLINRHVLCSPGSSVGKMGFIIVDSVDKWRMFSPNGFSGINKSTWYFMVLGTAKVFYVLQKRHGT